MTKHRVTWLWLWLWVYFFRNFPITNAKRFAKRTGIMQKIGLNISGSSPFEVPANRFAIFVANKKAWIGKKIEAKMSASIVIPSSFDMPSKNPFMENSLMSGFLMSGLISGLISARPSLCRKQYPDVLNSNALQPSNSHFLSPTPVSMGVPLWRMRNPGPHLQADCYSNDSHDRNQQQIKNKPESNNFPVWLPPNICGVFPHHDSRQGNPSMTYPKYPIACSDWQNSNISTSSCDVCKSARYFHNPKIFIDG